MDDKGKILDDLSILGKFLAALNQLIFDSGRPEIVTKDLVEEFYNALPRRLKIEFLLTTKFLERLLKIRTTTKTKNE
jgi:hypothetical protein